MRKPAKLSSHKSEKTVFFHSGIGLFVLLTLLIATGCRNTSDNSGKQPSTTYTDGYGLIFDLPDVCELLPTEDLDRMREKDPSLIFKAFTGLPFTGSTISLSAFSFPPETPIDSPFMIIVRYVPSPYEGDTLFSYKLMDYGTSIVGGKTLRYKISCIDSTDYNILYYLMKNDKSETLYEFKLVCHSENEIARAKNFLEWIALSVRFSDDNTEGDSLQSPVNYPH